MSKARDQIAPAFLSNLFVFLACQPLRTQRNTNTRKVEREEGLFEALAPPVGQTECFYQLFFYSLKERTRLAEAVQSAQMQ